MYIGIYVCICVCIKLENYGEEQASWWQVTLFMVMVIGQEGGAKT